MSASVTLPLSRRTGEGRLHATVIVLSAGASPYLERVMTAALRCEPGAAAVRLLWSGAGAVTSSLPPGIDVERIPPGTFDHGGTRQLALDRCTTDLLVLLSDDAVPVDSSWLRAIAAPFVDDRVAAVYGRQCARRDAPIAERVYRRVRYPEQSCRIDTNALRRAGSVALPVSNANAAYRVSVLKAVGGFPRPCAYGEDLLAAITLMRDGWQVVYAAEAAVWHSHSVSGAALFRRGREAGALSRRARSGTTGGGRSLRGGVRLAFGMLREGWRERGLRGVAAVTVDSALRLLGYLSGRLM